jgi:beta-fructofuranosidase
MLRLDDHWLWDSWLADDGEQYHLFHLRAPRALGDPGLRHERAVVGHAVSTDLTNWRLLEEALGPGPAGSWDDLAVWTGSVVRDRGRWWMFYTALNAGRGLGVKDQQIGVVVSDDLATWERVGDGPVVVPDPRWYRTLTGEEGPSETWRDPFVFRDPGGDGWHMLVTARSADGSPDDDGVIAHARSSDLLEWDLGPPVCEDGAGFGQLEVPQVHLVDGAPLLLFTCHPQEQTAARRAGGEFCAWTVPGEDLLGPWDIDLATPFVPEPTLFAAQLVRDREGGTVLLGFRNREPEGVWSFELLDPIPVRRDGPALVLR